MNVANLPKSGYKSNKLMSLIENFVSLVEYEDSIHDRRHVLSSVGVLEGFP